MKKLRLIVSFICLLSMGMFSTVALAQISKGGLPPSFSLKNERVLSENAQLRMPINFAVKELLEEDEFNAKNEITRPRVAINIPADISIDNSGEWFALPGEQEKRIWQVSVEAKGAEAIILSYDDFYLPTGSKLFIYNKDRTHVLGAFDNTSNPRGGAFSTRFVAGDVAVLEYVAPIVPSRDKAKIKISGVGYGYNYINIIPKTNETRLRPGNSSKCQVNVICSPEGDLWQENSKSVCQITALLGDNWSVCTGTLINNTDNDMTPYILSAFHCYDGVREGDLDVWQFNFFYRSTECANGNKYDTDAMETLIGAELIAFTPLHRGSDGLLLKLKDNIPGEWISQGRIIWAGWDRREDPAIMGKSGVGIHHPGGDMQKISTYTQPAQLISHKNFAGGEITGMNAHWEVLFVKTVNGWSETQGGSSGSGLINQNGLVIGALSGGPPGFECDEATGDKNRSYYGTMAYHWDKYGTDATTQMKTWLDPKGAGTADTCLAYPSQKDVINFVGNPNEIIALKSVHFSGAVYKADSIRWIFSGGSPNTSTEYNPTITYNEPGDFDVVLKAYKKNSKGQDTIIEAKKEKYVKVTEKGNPEPPKANVLAYEPMKNILVDDFSTSKIGDDKEYKEEIILNDEFKWNISASPKLKQPAAHGFDGEGDKFLWYKPGSSRASARVSRSFEATSSADIKLSFQMLIRPAGSDIDTVFVEYREKDGDEWESIYSSRGFATCEHSSSPDVWKLVEVELPKTTVTKGQFAFRVGSNWGYGVAIDNIKLQEMKISEKVEIWEHDFVRFFDLSSGTPVLYKYNFAGGDPAETTTEDPIIKVQYNTPGVYDIKQWVKNTKGEDSITRADYITVLPRILEPSTDSIFAECAQAIDKEITLKINKNWTATAPDWIVLDKYSGSVATEGLNDTDKIKVSVLENTTSISGRIGYIVLTTEDGVKQVNIKVSQSTVAPSKLKIKTSESVNVELKWASVPGTYVRPLSTCDISKKGGGTFESEAIYNKQWRTIVKGETSLPFNPKGWRWYKHAAFPPKEGDACIVSHSYLTEGNTKLRADNWLITPKLKITKEYHTLKFWIASHATKALDNYEVWLSEKPSITSTDDFTDNIITTKTAAYKWTKIEHDLTEYIGKEVFIAFRHKQYDKMSLKIDNVHGLELAECTESATSEPQMLTSKNAVIIPQTTEENSILDNPNTENSRQLASINKAMELKTNKAVFDVSSLNSFRWCKEPAMIVGAAEKPFWVAAKWSEDDLDLIKGTTIEAIEIALGVDVEIELFIMEGTTELHSQVVPAGTLKLGKPQVIKLTKPVKIFGGQDVYIGYKVLAEYKGFPAVADAGPPVKGKGNMFYSVEKGRWMELTEYGNRLTYNWYIIAYGKGGGDGYTIYRKRMTGIDNEYKFVAANITDSTFIDKNVMPGGTYHYKVTYWSGGAESCPTDEDSTFVLYQQQLQESKLIKKIYGDKNFMIDASAKDGNLLRSSIDDIDFFKNKNLAPVSLAIHGEDKGIVTLTGEPGSYSVAINKAGEAMLEATQAGIKDTLLAAKPIKIKVAVDRFNLNVKAQDKEKFYGENNPPLELIYGPFAYGDNPSNLAKLPEVNCYATANTLPGKEQIVVSVFADPNYNLKAEHGVLTIKPAGEGDYINIFTPYSADGYNDYFMAGYKIKVFNRAGILIYETSNTQELNIGWNGKIRQTQKMAEPGVYYYVVIDEKGKIIRNGSVTLIK